ncbi:MAG: MBL fold metallo-hydrolase [Dehalococcoidia bacterium]|nr:MBL fold metallo-hydrolase [Dehalococcoidia bacterium]
MVPSGSPRHTHWFRIGDLELLVVSDGVMRQDAGAVFGLVPRIMWEPYAGPLDEQYRMALGLNSLLVRAHGKTILIDTGTGAKGSRAPGAVSTESSGKLLANLAAGGIRPEDIDIVVNTHLHFDHAGGNTRTEAGRPVPAFPRARYLIQKGEWEAATHPNERTRGTYLAENIEPLADARQVEQVQGEVQVVPGVRLTPAPGHTEDHCIVELESGGDYAIYVGELAQHPVMLERLAWISAFDVLPLVSLETKRRLTEKAIEKRATLISVHAAYPGLGRLRAEDSKRRWEALKANGADA